MDFSQTRKLLKLAPFWSSRAWTSSHQKINYPSPARICSMGRLTTPWLGWRGTRQIAWRLLLDHYLVVWSGFLLLLHRRCQGHGCLQVQRRGAVHREFRMESSFTIRERHQNNSSHEGEWDRGLQRNETQADIIIVKKRSVWQ